MRRTIVAATAAAILLTACHYPGKAVPTPSPQPAPIAPEHP
ncbi:MULTISPECIES: hypothetical protein [unclassified Streptomyces]|nr:MULTISPECIES: hypothetical protein [unclassified Streptomyces]